MRRQAEGNINRLFSPDSIEPDGTTEAMVAELPKDEPAMPGGGDMGGMM